LLNLRSLPLLLCAGLLTACSSEKTQLPSNSVLRIPITASPDLLLSHGNEVNSNKIVDNIFERLIDLDESLAPVPAVASRWTIHNKNNEIEFEIDTSKRFHDGSKVRSQDVLNSFLRAYKSQKEILSQVRSLDGCLEKSSCEGFQTLSDSRFKIGVKNSNYPLLMKKLASAEASIIKESNGLYLGTGPYRIAQMNADQVVAEQFDNRAAFQKIIFHKVDAENAVKMFESGELDVISDLEFPVKKASLIPDLTYSQKIAGTYALVFNFKRKVFKKKENRLAVASIIDPVVYRDYAGGQDIAASGMIPVGYLGHSKKRHLVNLEAAARLIEKNTTPQERTVILAAREKFKGNKALEDYLVSRFHKVGLKLDIQFIPFEKVLSGFREGRFDMILKGDAPVNFDSSTAFDGYTGQKTIELAGYNSPALNRLLSEYEKETAKDKQLAILEKMETTFAEEIPAIPLFYPVFTTWYRRGLLVSNTENISVKFWNFSYQGVKVASLVRK